MVCLSLVLLSSHSEVVVTQHISWAMTPRNKDAFKSVYAPSISYQSHQHNLGEPPHTQYPGYNFMQLGQCFNIAWQPPTQREILYFAVAVVFAIGF